MTEELIPEERIYGDERRSQEQQKLLKQVVALLEEMLEERPAPPVVNVAPTDLTPLEQLLLRQPFPDPQVIAEAIASILPQDKTPEVAAALQAVTKQLERLNKKVTGLSTMPSGGSSGHVIVDSGIITSITQPVQVSGTVNTTAAINENRLDYDTRTDQNPVYVGDAPPGTATSAADWTVLKLHYDATNRLIRKQTRTNIAWDNRVTGWPA